MIAASFTSCSKDNDGFIDDAGEIIGGGSGDSQGQVVSGYEYFEPYTDWKGSKDDVKKYMKGLSGWSLPSEDSNTLTFAKNKPMTGVVYMFNSEGNLFCAVVAYYDASKLEDLKKKLEDKYGCTFKKTEDNSMMDTYNSGTFTYNGRNALIVISVTRTKFGDTMRVGYTF